MDIVLSFEFMKVEIGSIMHGHAFGGAFLIFGGNLIAGGT